MSSDYKAIVTRWYDRVWNQQRQDTIDELMAEGCLTKVEGLDAPLTRSSFKEYQQAFLSAVPDLRVEVLSVITEGQTAIASWRAIGTHVGPGLGIPPSGRPVDFMGLSVFEFAEDRIVSGFDSWNRGEMIASLMQIRMDELRSHVGLTMREAQVALLMAERFTHKEIASQLGIRPNTARRHCERVLSKLGIDSRNDVAQVLGKIPGSVLDATVQTSTHPSSLREAWLSRSSISRFRNPPANGHQSGLIEFVRNGALPIVHSAPCGGISGQVTLATLGRRGL
jgi:steroid delta-isomerase-like uncharacterized protein